MTTIEQIKHNSRYSEVELSWFKYMSSLAYSEKVASSLCTDIANEFRLCNEHRLARKYDMFAIEEMNHYELASKMSPVKFELTPKAKIVFSCSLLKGSDNLLLKLIILHSVFESTALSILGYLYANCNNIFDNKVSKTVKHACHEILKDEVDHVSNGVETILKRYKGKDIDRVPIYKKRIIKYHMSFVKLGFKSFFSSCPDYNNHILKITRKFDFNFKNSMDKYGLSI